MATNIKSKIKPKRKHTYGGLVNPFATGGPLSYNPEEAYKDKKFQQWYKNKTLEGKNNIPYSEDLSYDYYSFYKNKGEGNITDHFPDTYKRIGHPTFSNESIYSTPEKPGGSWKGEIYSKKGKFLNSFADGGGLQTASSITSGIGQAASGIPVVGGIIGGVLQGAGSIMGAFGAKKQQEAALKEQQQQELQQKMLSMPTAQGGIVPGVVNPYMFALGGYMGGKHDPINFLTKYQAGGTHEQNPLGGIPLGMGANGKPNVVEQGEASFNFKDGKYIFSNRLKIR